MNLVSARILADSISVTGKRLTTVETTFHRFVLAEINTHCQLARNSASSRAIPVERMLERFLNTPAYPLSWPAEQAGMSGGTELAGQDLQDAQVLLGRIHESTYELIDSYLRAHPDKATRLHKSLLNRPMEWAQWHTAIVTASHEYWDWPNFFRLRDSEHAQPEIRAVAQAIRAAMADSTPAQLGNDEWHLPLTGFPGDEELSAEDLVRVSCARCARVSYLTHDGHRDVSADLTLYDRLRTDGHLSPLEHAAHPAPGRWAKFTGWRQARWYAERRLMATVRRLSITPQTYGTEYDHPGG